MSWKDAALTNFFLWSEISFWNCFLKFIVWYSLSAEDQGDRAGMGHSLPASWKSPDDRGYRLRCRRSGSVRETCWICNTTLKYPPDNTVVFGNTTDVGNPLMLNRLLQICAWFLHFYNKLSIVFLWILGSQQNTVEKWKSNSFLLFNEL